MTPLPILSGEELERLEKLAKAATPGPWERMSGRELVRAIRGDLAVPFADILEPFADPLLDAPTVRSGGGVVFRASSRDARHSAASKQAALNAAFIAAANPQTALALIAALRGEGSGSLQPQEGASVPTEGPQAAVVGEYRRVLTGLLSAYRKCIEHIADEAFDLVAMGPRSWASLAEGLLSTHPGASESKGEG